MQFRVPDALFSSDNMFGIPTLLRERQGDFVDLPVRGWGAVARKDRMRGTWHFYVDDEKFSGVWKHPDSVLKTKCIATVEANFSTDDQMPLALGLYQIYRKRWLARYWQEYGLPIWVDLNVARPYYDYNLLGVPKGWRSYATSASDARIEILEEHAAVAQEHAGGHPIRLLVYGGGENVRAICGERGWVNVPDARIQARKVNK